MNKLLIFTNKMFNLFKTHFYLFKYVFNKKSGKWYVASKFLLSIIDPFFSIVITIIPGMIINELIYGKSIRNIILYAGILVVLPAIKQILHIFIGVFISKKTDDIRVQTNIEFFRHLSQVDIEFREKPDNKTSEDIARETLCNATDSVNLFFGMLSSLAQLILLVSIVSTLHPIIVIFTLINVILSSLLTKKANDRKNELTKEWYKKGRYVNRFENYLIQFVYAKDVALFNLTDYFIKKYSKAKNEYNDIKYKRDGYTYKSNLVISILNVLQEGVLYFYMIASVITGKMLVGNISIFTNAAHQFSNSLNSVFNQFTKMSDSTHNIDETIKYMNTPLLKMVPGTLEPFFDENSVIEFQNVSFRYAGNNRFVLKNFNMKIHWGEHICIVGENGVGKTTFIKLLLRIYRPTTGCILLNGTNIEEYDYKKYWELFSPVYQDCTLFGGLTFKENIVLDNEYDNTKFQNICNANSLKYMVENMPNGTDTIIDNWVDEEGVKPSGGEKQRMVIARSMYHKRKIVLLDEPTAALDPKAEYEIYTQFHNMIQDKCAILITHRLSAVQLADKVAVFDNGSVAEYGTHKELYEKGGIYTEMFNKQADFYRDEKSSDN